MFLQISTSDVFNFTIETGWMYLTITYRYLREKETTIRENRSKKTWLWTKLIKLNFRFSAVSRFFYDLDKPYRLLNERTTSHSLPRSASSCSWCRVTSLSRPKPPCSRTQKRTSRAASSKDKAPTLSTSWASAPRSTWTRCVPWWKTRTRCLPSCWRSTLRASRGVVRTLRSSERTSTRLLTRRCLWGSQEQLPSKMEILKLLWRDLWLTFLFFPRKEENLWNNSRRGGMWISNAENCAPSSSSSSSCAPYALKSPL